MFRCWGKARFSGEGAAGAALAHPLPCHCLDVAAVASALLRADGLLAARAAALSPLPAAQTVSLLVFFAAVHDLGKFSLPFQWLVPDLARAAGLPEWNVAYDGRRFRHTRLAHLVWQPLRGDVARACRFEDPSSLKPLGEAAFGHHGEPVAQGSGAVPGFNRGLADSAREFTNAAAALFLRGDLTGFAPLEPEPALARSLGEESFRPLSWLAAGLFVLADWIGSNGTWFPPRPQMTELRGYWGQAQSQAEDALSWAGVLPATHSEATGFHTLLPHLPRQAAPHPMQQAVLDLPEPRGPELLILEDVTGGGKTEAAVLAAHRVMAAGLASGLFVGLPTMATANAMYSRLARGYRALFADPKASLVLAHGGRAGHEEYLRSIGLETASGGARDAKDAEAFEASEAVCGAWIADNRKKALLAPCGAGTLDQALLAILPSRHQSLRLLGLSRSVLVADEVHAYDEYTGRLLEVLLTFHAALGGSAVLLSATMPQALRARLAGAWRQGRSLAGGTEADGEDTAASIAAASIFGPAPEPLSCEAFPLLTRVTDAALDETPVAPARGLDVAIQHVDEEAAMFRTLAEAHRAGACACWVRNTVDDAVRAWRLLTEEWGVPRSSVDLFHARFAGCDRRAVEMRVLECFGKDSNAGARAGRVLVATQVVEQSLDLDFDLLLTDLAPMELLIQRAGRCHRHLRGPGQGERPEGYRTARTLVLGPQPVPDPGPDWYAAMFEGGRWVYPRPGMLWHTARLLAAKGRLRLPEDARELVEGAYAGDAPEALQDQDNLALGADYGQRAMADQAALQFGEGYCTGSGMQWDRDQKTPTRLGQDTQQIRLVCCEGDAPRLWASEAPGPANIRACMDSELRVPVSKLREPVIPPEWSERLDALRESLPDASRWSVLLPLLPDGAGGWTGRAMNGKGEEVEVGYGPLGLFGGNVPW